MKQVKNYIWQGFLALLLSVSLAGATVSVRAEGESAIVEEIQSEEGETAGDTEAAPEVMTVTGTETGESEAGDTSGEIEQRKEPGVPKEPVQEMVTYSSLKASATKKQLSQGKFVVDVHGLSCENGVKQVRMQVYSKGNKSNSHTYTADKKASGHYRVTVDLDNHKNLPGEYKVCLVVTDKKGKKHSLQEKPVYDLSLKKGVVAARLGKTEKMVTLSVSGASVRGGIGKLEFCVYPKTDGAKKGDIFQAKLNKATGEYTVSVKIKQLSSDSTGTYVAQAKAYTAWGTVQTLGSQEFQLSDCDGELSVNLADENAGKYKLRVSALSAPSGIKKVQFKVWRDSEKEALLYEGKGNGEARACTLNLTDFQGSLGKYYVQALVTMGNGKVSVAAKDTFKPELSDYLYVLKTEKNTARKVYMRNLSQKGSVTFKVWSDKNGKDDVKSYKAKRIGNTAKVTFTTGALKHSGKVYVAAYVGGDKVKTIAIKIPASDMKKNGWYYEKYGGKTYKFYYKNDKKLKDLTKILGIGKSESLYIEVNRRHCTVTVFAKDGKKGYIIPVISFACSVGKAGTPTPRGTYYTDRKHRWKVLMGPSYGQYATHVVGGIYFHSVAGSSRSVHNIKASNYNMLGSPASHGCIRLCVRDAKWIYDHCALRTKVKIFDSSYKGPLGKPSTIKISGSTNYDPTDPAVR